MSADPSKTLEGKPFSARELREALGRFATGVTVVTTRDGAGVPVGMTANSFNSVSLEPPLVLWSVDRGAMSAPAFERAEHFAIHVLAVDQVDVSNRFARKGEDKFSGIAWHDGPGGVPVLEGALSVFHCRTHAIHDGGDHHIVVGEVEAIETRAGDGLVFAAGGYAEAQPLRPMDVQTEGGTDPDAPIEALLLYHLARATRAMSDGFHDAVREAGLSVPQWRVLASLSGGVTRALPDLAARAFVSHAALTEMVDALEADGLCTASRAADPEGWRVMGTQAGDRRIEHLFELGAKRERAALRGAPEGALERLLETLKRVTANLEG